ncbi:serine/threonine-protein kinase [Kamptonema formosum]|uniref:serine/threonine-protein kinase n=1 Tax=Kamptonema formosum TaxID=331992 RepID=UPI00034BAEC5|nr:serine/threonine-protein kinase [Oscillatoria sp. PCC 10802]
MVPRTCSKGHNNPTGHRFCSQCGEKLQAEFSCAPPAAPSGSPIILESRYRLVRQIGQGGFGRTYLAEDTNRFGELCVLKEFAPQVQHPTALRKAQELFDREASVLYKLQHPQIPRFRELCRCEMSGSERLFLVQDFVGGQSCREVLDAGVRFGEAEMLKLLLDLLPVLGYIHSQGVIHRDISPENLILRSSDRLPVLIDFGGVKEVATSAVSQFAQLIALSTQLGKPGYAPEEQIRLGRAYPSSDLYALAVTAVVLLTGKEPQELYDSVRAVWRWRSEVRLSPMLEGVLNKMLAHSPSDRYQDAGEVVRALQAVPPALPSNLSQLRTVAVAPPPAAILTVPANIPAAKSNPNPPPTRISFFAIPAFWHPVRPVAAIATCLVFLAAISARVVSNFPANTPEAPAASLSLPEEASLRKIVDRRQALKIPEQFFNRAVNELFYEQNPVLRGRLLTNSSKDEYWRRKWREIADSLLAKLERANLSEKARSQLGSYTLQDFEIASGKVKKSTFSRQVDARFYKLFPELRGRTLHAETWQQVWYAIAADRLAETGIELSLYK